MQRTFFRSKIHRASVTDTYLNYEGSITVDQALLEAADINPYEQVHVLNINNGQRFITYAINGEKNSGVIQVNGAAAHLCKKNDLLIIISYCQLNSEDIDDFKPNIIYVDSSNKISN